MQQSNNTYNTTLELDNFLTQNGYFDEEDENKIAEINQNIASSWQGKYESSISKDIKSKFKDIEIAFGYSIFRLSDDSSQGGPCTFVHYSRLSEKRLSESLNVLIKTLVNYKKTIVCLDSEYANIEKYDGNSKALHTIFNILKTSEKDPGYFNPVTLADLAE